MHFALQKDPPPRTDCSFVHRNKRDHFIITLSLNLTNARASFSLRICRHSSTDCRAETELTCDSSPHWLVTVDCEQPPQKYCTSVVHCALFTLSFFTRPHARLTTQVVPSPAAPTSLYFASPIHFFNSVCSRAHTFRFRRLPALSNRPVDTGQLLSTTIIAPLSLALLLHRAPTSNFFPACSPQP